MPIHPAIFVDRDGTLVEDRGCLRTSQELELFPDTVPALLQLQRCFRLCIVTNQPWIARGEVAEEDVTRLHAALCARLAAAGVRIDGVYTCPHRRADGCDCIKPRPRLLHQAAAAHGLDLARSWVVGDHPHDVELATTAGCTGGVYLLTGHGERHLAELPPEVTVMPGIRDAAEWILDVTIFERWRTHRGAGLETAARRLADGGAVAVPTETVHGLGANAWDARATARVVEIKRRAGLDLIVSEPLPGDGLAVAPSDLLLRAAHTVGEANP